MKAEEENNAFTLSRDSLFGHRYLLNIESNETTFPILFISTKKGSIQYLDSNEEKSILSDYDDLDSSDIF